MKTAFSIFAGIFIAVVLKCAAAGEASRSPAQGVASDIVTSPLWQNHYTAKIGDKTWGAGFYTEEANRVIAPLLQALKTYFEAKKQEASNH